MPRSVELRAGDAPQAWARLGFALDGPHVRLGAVAVRCTGDGGGLTGWSVSERAGRLDPHPNGASGADHIVLVAGDLSAAVADVVALGGEERRRAGPPAVPVPMAFVRLGDTVVEVAQGDGPARLWGLAVVVADLDRVAADLGARLGRIRAAVQPGRHIATVRPEAGLGTALAFMTPRVRARPAAAGLDSGDADR